ncbi:putative ubiquitin system component Cue, UBA-like superfamily [Helianthus annuus]|uniref:Ubiquitin system component Cue, UBA-like superfamily n=1 Tax=Helianthus annuus TaxID=4232 RepID=A0A9K3N538_HELAN|nr:putative ubiquitin system component Cue, UBA-like superfamily [Helianthus annuus]KAJ0514427.1 putative ubiquitin system component CUE, UBA-like superfamily [Helianthus annuus]
MSAIVCGKRSFFEDLQTSPNSASPPASKKIRCFTSTSPVRFSSFATSPPSPSLVDKLRSVFPNMDKKLLEEALEKSGNDIDSAIKSLNELSLGYVNGVSGSPGLANTIVDKGLVTANEDVSLENSPRNGAEWVELFVTEMTSATSIDDARLRAMRVLESLEKSITERAAGDAAETLHKASFSSQLTHPNTQHTHVCSENLVFKEQIEVLLRENAILKRAVAIQHERQKEYDERNIEVQQLKQLLSQYQEQVRTLEVNNYALTMHLKQAQGNNSIPGRFHPDIF